MTLKDALILTSESQEVMICMDDDHVSGNAGALQCYLSDDVAKSKVYNIEAERDVLKVWVHDYD